MQPSQEEIVAILLGAKYELGWVHAVVHERSRPVTTGMIGAQENGILRRRCTCSQIPVEGEHVRMLGGTCKRSMSVQDIRGRRNQGSEIKSWLTDLTVAERDQMRFGDLGVPESQHRDLMAELDQTAGKPHHHALRSTVAFDRKQTVNIEGYMHGAGMYPCLFVVANQIRT